ncbi:phosphorylase [Methylobacterium sp. WL120]|uniref:phosphorylase n=1 Tax=Methylobacterium sp. WL120 TaxID=2603887 RepID=UPI0011CAAB15|nr:phosphorylase [Methylobacterium sp. WL120]TXM71037.1 phosphorylase [Methylobacterium sp. WL120]
MSLQPNVLVVAGLAREARIAAGRGVEAIQAGGSPQRLRLLLDARAAPGCRGVVSFGIAGGLDPALRPGDVVVATGIVADARWPADARWTAILLKKLETTGRRVVTADLAGVDAAILTVADKAVLRRETGAAGVDMESHVAAAYAARHGLPFAAIRVVCDPAERALPAFAAQALKPNGDPDILAVLRALATGRARPRDLIGLARDSSAAFKALAAARATLGAELGLSEI